MNEDRENEEKRIQQEPSHQGAEPVDEFRRALRQELPQSFRPTPISIKGQVNSLFDTRQVNARDKLDSGVVNLTPTACPLVNTAPTTFTTDLGDVPGPDPVPSPILFIYEIEQDCVQINIRLKNTKTRVQGIRHHFRFYSTGTPSPLVGSFNFYLFKNGVLFDQELNHNILNNAGATNNIFDFTDIPATTQDVYIFVVTGINVATETDINKLTFVYWNEGLI